MCQKARNNLFVWSIRILARTFLRRKPFYYPTLQTFSQVCPRHHSSRLKPISLATFKNTILDLQCEKPH
ncbi:hypothetical protein FF38_00080 [Lucilia cuprina]|uniref:Uncharacterized protein n=1 Tax=Lucilia cuprina TaxID=7375 RepID=A0A0L0BL21_LUCCU|nr:hypothetical protein FF38_00080 [Lucilia cuprina]